MWIEIFKSGTHTDSSGRSSEYSPHTLSEISSRYNSQLQTDPTAAAPVVKGHPADNSPAYGWVERLARRGDKLVAKLRDLQPEFVDEVRKGMFKKVSISLYGDNLLRHIGFLGAAAPAVKGLLTPQFSEGELTSSDDVNPFMDYIYEFTETEITEEPAKPSLDYQELISNNLKLAREVSILNSHLAMYEKESRTNDYRNYTASLRDDSGNMTISPAQSDFVVDFLEVCYYYDIRECLGSDVTMEDRFKQFMNSLKKPRVPLGTLPPPKKNEFEEEFAGKFVSPARLEIHARAKALQREIAGISYEEAALVAQKQFINNL